MTTAEIVVAYDEPHVALVQLVLDAVDSPHTRRAYARALARFFAWHRAAGAPRLTRATVNRYRAHLVAEGLAASTINQQLAALRRLAREAVEQELAEPAAVAGLEAVRGVKRQGTRAGNWLTLVETQALLRAPSTSTLKGLRDRALLTALVGCGLRRAELVSLRVEQLQERDGRPAIIDLVGKRGRVRSIPMPTWAREAIRAWTAAAAITAGCVFRPLHRSGVVRGEAMSTQAVHDVVREYGAALGHPRLAPHDLRRTFAKLAVRGGSTLEQLRESLGHASVQTTEIYVGANQDFRDAPADRLGLEL